MVQSAGNIKNGTSQGMDPLQDPSPQGGSPFIKDGSSETIRENAYDLFIKSYNMYYNTEIKI